MLTLSEGKTKLIFIHQDRWRQYPLYSRNAPPAALASHFSGDTFEKSQAYGKDKAKFSFITGIYRQVLDSALIQYGFYAYAWSLAGELISRFGYGLEYEVRFVGCTLLYSTNRFPDPAVKCVLRRVIHCVYDSYDALHYLPDFCSGGEARLQQNDMETLRYGPHQGMDTCGCDWCSIFICVLMDVQVGWGPFCTLVNGIFVSISINP